MSITTTPKPIAGIRLRSYREDTSRLRPADCYEKHCLVYEPLVDLVTDDWLRPYVWGVGDVSFYYHWDKSYRQKIAETRYLWTSGTIVVSDGQTWKTVSAKCVHRNGQWCMEWLCRRVNISERTR
jgi:hypothetical protein